MTEDINIEQIGVYAKEASRLLAKTPSNQKNHALHAMSKHILNDKKIILEANKVDIENIKLKKGMDEALENIENLIDKVDNL